MKKKKDIEKPQSKPQEEPVQEPEAKVNAEPQAESETEKLQRELGLTYIFVAHDLAVVRHIADYVCIMYLGNIVEMMDSDEMFTKPLHPYTKALISAIPVVDYHLEKTRKRIELEGEIPSPINRPTGCPFHPRCPYAKERCSKEVPVMDNTDPKHPVCCFYYKDLNKETNN